MKIFCLLIILSILKFSSLSGQSNILTGTVLDRNQNPIPFAHIGIVGIPKGTITEESGDFRLDTSDISYKDTLFVSAIGYKTQKFGFKELSPEKELVINLEKETYSQNEIQVTARKRNSIHFGRDKSGGNSGWIYSGIATGSEAGMIFSNSKNVILSKFKFHINTTDFDSLLYRIHVYEIANDKMIPLNKTEIRKNSPAKNGWIAVDLDEYQLSTNQDFAITTEILKGWKEGKSSKRGRIKFTGRNAISKQMVQRSHRFIKTEYINSKLNMVVSGYVE